MMDELDDPSSPDDDPGETEKGKRLASTLRNAVVAGLSAVLTTEEGIRSALGDMRLTKEAIAFLAQQTERTRKDLLRAVSAEIKSYLASVDLTRELRKALTGLDLEVTAQVRFLGDEDARTEVHTRVRPARNRRGRRAAP